MGAPLPQNLRRPVLLTAELEKKISPRNRELIETYLQHKRVSGQVQTEGRVKKLRWLLTTLAYWLKTDFDRADVDDLKRLVVLLEQQVFKPATKQDFRMALKNFYKVIEGEDQEFPKKIRWLKAKAKRRGEETPEFWLVEDEIRAVVEATDHVRDRAFILGLYESGCRISEYLNIRWEHVQFESDGTVLLVVTGKTGRRTIPILASVPLLAAWRAQHPSAENPQSAVWVALDRQPDGRPFSYNRAVDILYESACTAKRKFPDRFRKNQDLIHPHLLRHSRATDCANKGWTEAQMCVFFGWRFGSAMPAIYIKRAGVDIRARVKQDNGLPVNKEETESKLAPKKCYRCHIANAAIAKFCSGCGAILDLSAAQDLMAAQQVSRHVLAKGSQEIEHRLVEIERKLVAIARIQGKSFT